MSEPQTDLLDLRDRMRRFIEERDWARFHDPKSLVLALVGEVGEVAELFQWLRAEQAADDVRDGPLRERIGEELADVLLYLVRLADVCEVNLAEAARVELCSAEAKYPVEDARGAAPIRD